MAISFWLTFHFEDGAVYTYSDDLYSDYEEQDMEPPAIGAWSAPFSRGGSAAGYIEVFSQSKPIGRSMCSVHGAIVIVKAEWRAD